MSTTTLLSSLFAYKAWANEELLATLQTLDAEVHATERHTAIRIVNHTHVVDQIFQGHLANRPHGHTATNTVETPTLEALARAMKDTDRWYLEYVASLTPEIAAETVEFAFVDGSAARMSREEMLMHVITHGGYHRGAAGRIVAQLSIAAPRDIYTRFLHITEPQRRERA